MGRYLGGLLAVAAGIIAGAPAQAYSVDYSIADVTFTVNDTDPGLVIQVDDDLLSPKPFNFTLDDGDSTGWFDVADIWTDETYVNGDDQIAKPITATFDFDLPDDAFVDVGGETKGIVKLFGSIQAGKLRWDDPKEVTTSAGHVFKVWLSNETFNKGKWWKGLNEGEAHGATIQAKIKQIHSTPTPAAAGTGLALLGAIAAGRRRRAA